MSVGGGGAVGDRRCGPGSAGVLRQGLSPGDYGRDFRTFFWTFLRMFVRTFVWTDGRKFFSVFNVLYRTSSPSRLRTSKRGLVRWLVSRSVKHEYYLAHKKRATL